jgi:hypothetical protein
MALPKLSKSERAAYRARAATLVASTKGELRSAVEPLELYPPDVVVPDVERNPDRVKARYVYARIRFFFVTPKGCPPVSPVERLYRTRETWSSTRSSHYPYHPMGWVFVKQRTEVLTEHGWSPRGSDPNYFEPPSVNVDCGGKVRSLLGQRLDGYHSAEVPCDEACVYARGKKCECSCSGRNHGLGDSVLMVTFRQLGDGQIRNALIALGLLERAERQHSALPSA